MSKNSEEPEITTTTKIDEEKEIEKKLSDLMNMGWTLLEQSCPLESCHCPLLKSLDGNKYCVKCEMWQFPDKETTKQRYTDLVLKAHQELAIREMGLTKVNKRFNINMFGKEALLNSLRAKLAYLSSILNETPDMTKSQQILQNIELCLKNIRTINESM
jgi:uncharacterized Zn finger protein (UPF0148 family)